MQTVRSSFPRTYSPQRGDNARAAAPRKARRGFTLIELLIVVVVLGILAMLVVPQFTSASQQARENTVKDELRYLRTQIIVYKAQHQDVPPGYSNNITTSVPNQAAFSDQMIGYTDMFGHVSMSAAPGYPFGPYLSQLPNDSLNNRSTFLIVPNNAALPIPDGSTGWIYKPQTQEIIPNMAGTDAAGVAYTNY